MRPRRFTGATLLDAVRRAKDVCGPDALVVAARPVSRRRWFERERVTDFEVTVLEPPGAEAVAAELRRLSDGIAPLTAGLGRVARVEEGLRDLRASVEALERRIAEDAAARQPSRARVAHVRIASQEAGGDPGSTPRSVQSWNRD